MKKINPPSTSKEFTLSAKFRQKRAVLQLCGPRRFSRLSVQLLPRLPERGPRAVLTIGQHYFRCAIGRNGIGVKCREGDAVTPSGHFLVFDWLRQIDNWKIFRSDCRSIKKTDGWCDDPDLYCYNRKVTLPFRGRAEMLWRDDGIYDVIGLLNYNCRPRILGRGSAIFLHLAHPDYRPTAGCLALARADMRKIQSLISRRVQVDIGIYPLRRRVPKIADPIRT